MTIVLNYRHKNERLEEAFRELGHNVLYNVWDINAILAQKADAVIFEFKQILKEEIRFLKLSLRLKKAGIPRITWCLDIPNIGARQWKLSAILQLRLVDIFATHSIQGLSNSRCKIIYLPNAAWVSQYNLQKFTLEEMRDPEFYTVDVSFIGNIDSIKHPEHQHRTEFLNSLGTLLERNNISYHFADSRHLNINSQIELIQKSRINLNYGCAADRYEIKSWGLPERCYGIPACGGFLLADERVHAKDDFKIDEEIAIFKDINDCIDKIRYYIPNSEVRRRITENAYKKVLSQHTYMHRAKKLMDIITSLKSCSVGGS
ncbi:MAG: glycosyltransferase family 1 protein [Nitrospirae bacterium]|nr:glycosyltransferase family 1 protein [Nitrospirota bacterium]